MCIEIFKMANKVFLTKFKLQYDWLKNTLDMSNSKTHTSSVITARLRKLEDRYSALSEAYENILINTDDSEIITMYDKEFREAEEWYNQLEARSAAYPNLDGTHVPTESTQTARLPPINLSVFDGDLFSWTSFYSLYSSLVLSRKDISKTEKFHYLFSHVQNEPRLLLKHLPMVDDSLDSALEILKSRYENKRLLVDSNISRILNIPALNKCYGLRNNVLNPLLECTRALKNLDLPVDEWSYLLLFISLNKLPAEIKTRFEQKYGGDSTCLPTFNQLIEFLQNECRLLDTANNKSCVTSPTAAGPAVRENRYSNNIRNSHAHVTDLGQRRSPVLVKQCNFCQLPRHTISECFKFRNLTNGERKDFIKNNDLCFKCFEKHTARTCHNNVPCDRCGNIGHNKMLCSHYIARSGVPATERLRSGNECNTSSSDRTVDRQSARNVHIAQAATPAFDDSRFMKEGGRLNEPYLGGNKALNHTSPTGSRQQPNNNN